MVSALNLAIVACLLAAVTAQDPTCNVGDCALEFDEVSLLQAKPQIEHHHVEQALEKTEPAAIHKHFQQRSEHGGIQASDVKFPLPVLLDTKNNRSSRQLDRISIKKEGRLGVQDLHQYDQFEVTNRFEYYAWNQHNKNVWDGNGNPTFQQTLKALTDDGKSPMTKHMEVGTWGLFYQDERHRNDRPAILFAPTETLKNYPWGLRFDMAGDDYQSLFTKVDQVASCSETVHEWLYLPTDCARVRPNVHNGCIFSCLQDGCQSEWSQVHAIGWGGGANPTTGSLVPTQHSGTLMDDKARVCEKPVRWNVPEICVRAIVNELAPIYEKYRMWSFTGGAITSAANQAARCLFTGANARSRRDAADCTHATPTREEILRKRIRTDFPPHGKAIDTIDPISKVCWDFVNDMKGLYCEAKGHDSVAPYKDLCTDQWQGYSDSYKERLVDDFRHSKPSFFRP